MQPFRVQRAWNRIAGSTRLRSAGKMARILIANIDNENMLADERAFTAAFCRASSITAGRMAWFAEPGDIVVLPRDISAPFKDYLARLRGHAPASIAYVTPDWAGASVRPLGSHELLRLGLPERLLRLMRGRRDWSLLPYCYERGAQLLAEALEIETERSVRPFLRQGGAELLNDKRIFRSLAAGRGIAIAAGVVAGDPRSLEAAILSLIDLTGTVIVKQDRHSGGLGNLIVSRAGLASGLGASEVIKIDNETAIADAARMAWDRLAYLERVPLVVEVYYAVAAVVTAEFRVDGARNAVSFVNCGEMRQAPILSGLIMPWSLSPCPAADFIAGATELARLTCDLGYDGLINVDGIVTAEGCVIYNEFNGRIGGCSHIHHILQAVTGPGYADRLVVASHSRTAPADFAQIIDLLEARKLGFDAAAGRGIVLTAEDCAESGFLEYLSVAASRDEAMRLEAAFEGLLEGLGAAATSNGAQHGGIAHLATILSHLPAIDIDPAAAPQPALLQGAARKS
jgi:hypothetical protein